MSRITIEELCSQRLAAMTDAERAEFDEALASARLAIEVDEKVREDRWADGVAECPGAWETGGHGSD